MAHWRGTPEQIIAALQDISENDSGDETDNDSEHWNFCPDDITDNSSPDSDNDDSAIYPGNGRSRLHRNEQETTKTFACSSTESQGRPTFPTLPDSVSEGSGSTNAGQGSSGLRRQEQETTISVAGPTAERSTSPVPVRQKGNRSSPSLIVGSVIKAPDGTEWKVVSTGGINSGRRALHNILREDPGPTPHAK